MEYVRERFEHIGPEQQYEIAATVAMLRLFPALYQIEEVQHQYGVTENINAAGSAPIETSFATITRVGAHDLAFLEKFIGEESPRKYTVTNSVHYHCLQLGLIDSSGNMTEAASLAFRYELQDDETFNDIFIASDLKRLEPILAEVSDYALKEVIMDRLESHKPSDLLLQYKHFVTFWIGEYDRVDYAPGT